MLYFAYGSNMSLARLTARVSTAEKIGNGTLKDHSVEFHKVSKDGSAKCDIVKPDATGIVTHGVVFEFSENQLDALNRAEGIGKGYDSKNILIKLNDRSIVETLTYFATKIDKSLKPYHWYKHHVLFGAEENELPVSYIETLEAAESIEDPDRSRALREMSMYR